MATKQKKNEIIHGDCVKTLATLPAGSVDLAFADPPFNIGYDYDEYNDDLSCNDYLNWSRDWIKGVIRVLKPNGTFWLAIGDEYAAELKVMVTRELGLTCRSWVIWYYTFGVHCTHKFTRSHAHMFHFVKDPKDFTFNTDDIRVPSARQLVYGDKRANPKGRVPDDTWIIEPTELPKWEAMASEGAASRRSGHRPDNLDTSSSVQPSETSPPESLDVSTSGRLDVSPPLPDATPKHDTFLLRPQDVANGFSADSDTWYFPRVCGTFKQRKGFHGCQMPEQLLARIIKACTNKGDLVLDPFTGSGTTLAVAKKLNRNYLGTELSKEYATESKKRLENIKPGDPLDGAADPLKSAPKTKNGTTRTKEGKRVKAKASA